MSINPPDHRDIWAESEALSRPAEARKSRSVLPYWISGLALALSLLTFVSVSTDVESGASGAPSLYEAPDDLSALIRMVQQSTVTVECGQTQGSGWVIDLGSPDEDASEEDLELDRQYPTEVVTNHHVIEDCVSAKKSVSVTSKTDTFDAVLYSWDEDNDLALIGIRQSPPALRLSNRPKPGWWAMSLGTPYGLAGTVSIGNVMNVDSGDVVSTAPINSGNSGGPLINSRGEVMGTNTWTRIGSDYPQDWNVAVGLNKLCREIVDCGNDPYWP